MADSRGVWIFRAQKTEVLLTLTVKFVVSHLDRADIRSEVNYMLHAFDMSAGTSTSTVYKASSTALQRHLPVGVTHAQVARMRDSRRP